MLMMTPWKPGRASAGLDAADDSVQGMASMLTQAPCMHSQSMLLRPRLCRGMVDVIAKLQAAAKEASAAAADAEGGAAEPDDEDAAEELAQEAVLAEAQDVDQEAASGAGASAAGPSEAVAAVPAPAPRRTAAEAAAGGLVVVKRQTDRVVQEGAGLAAGGLPAGAVWEGCCSIALAQSFV